MTDEDDDARDAERSIRMAALEVEQALLGLLMFDETALDIMAVGLDHSHFFEPFHQRLFALIQAEYKMGRKADPLLLAGKFETDAAFHDLGGVRYFADLVDRAPPASNVNDYARVILNNWQLREVRSLMTQLNYMTDAGDMIGEIREQLGRIDAFEDDISEFEDLPTIAERRVAELNDMVVNGTTPGLKTGLRCFDRLGGLMPSTLWVIGGRPSMGKTALLRCMLDGGARLNPDYDFPFYSIEMTKNQSVDRSLSAESMTVADFMNRPAAYNTFKRPNADMVTVLATIRRNLPTNVLISSRPRVGIEDVRRGAMRLKARRKRPIGAIGIDYLQIMEFYMSRGESMAGAIGRITSEAKRVAKDLDCAVVLLSQLSRKVEERDDPRPMLADLKESSSIEQDADYVLFPFRKVYYLERRGKPKAMDEAEYNDRIASLRNRMDVIVGKARDDAVGDIEMFADMAHDIVRNPS